VYAIGRREPPALHGHWRSCPMVPHRMALPWLAASRTVVASSSLVLVIYVFTSSKIVTKIKNSGVALVFETFSAWDHASARVRADEDLRDRRNLARKTARANESPAWVSANKIPRKHKSLDSGVSKSAAAHRREGAHRKAVASSPPMLFVHPASDCLMNWDADVVQLPLSKDFASRPRAVTVGLQDDSMCLLTGGYSREEIEHWCVKRNIGLGFLNIDSLNHRLELPCSSSRATRSGNSDASFVCWDRIIRKCALDCSLGQPLLNEQHRLNTEKLQRSAHREHVEVDRLVKVCKDLQDKMRHDGQMALWCATKLGRASKVTTGPSVHKCRS